GHDGQVWEQREADDRPGDRPRSEDEPGIAQLGEQAGAGGGDAESDQGAERRAEDPDIADHAGSGGLQRGVAPARRAGSAEPSMRRPAPTPGRTGSAPTVSAVAAVGDDRRVEEGEPDGISK